MLILRKTREAFSMIELLLYIGMISVFSLVITSYWGSMTELNTRGEAITAVTSEANMIMGSLTRIIYTASAVNTPAAGSSGNSLSLAMTDVAKNPTTITFTGGQLLVQEGVSTAVNLLSNRVVLDSINFQNISTSGFPAAVRIELQLSNNNTSGRSESDYSLTFYDTASLRK